MEYNLQVCLLCCLCRMCSLSNFAPLEQTDITIHRTEQKSTEPNTLRKQSAKGEPSVSIPTSVASLACWVKLTFSNAQSTRTHARTLSLSLSPISSKYEKGSIISATFDYHWIETKIISLPHEPRVQKEVAPGAATATPEKWLRQQRQQNDDDSKMFFNVRKTPIGRPFNMPFTQRCITSWVCTVHACGFCAWAYVWLFATPEMLSHRISCVCNNRNTNETQWGKKREAETEKEMEMEMPP